MQPVSAYNPLMRRRFIPLLAILLLLSAATPSRHCCIKVDSRACCGSHPVEVSACCAGHFSADANVFESSQTSIPVMVGSPAAHLIPRLIVNPGLIEPLLRESPSPIPPLILRI